MSNKQEKTEQHQTKVERAGRKIQRLGYVLTLLFTLPLVGVVLFGFVGLFSGLLIGGISVIVMSSEK